MDYEKIKNKLGIDRINALLELAGSEDKGYKSILIARADRAYEHALVIVKNMEKGETFESACKIATHELVENMKSARVETIFSVGVQGQKIAADIMKIKQAHKPTVTELYAREIIAQILAGADYVLATKIAIEKYVKGVKLKKDADKIIADGSAMAKEILAKEYDTFIQENKNM